MSDVLSTFSTRRTPQSQPRIPDQVRNAAGGFAYRTGDELRLHRFLTLGTDGGTYYTNARDLTKDNAEVVLRMVADKGLYTVSQIVEISTAGRAPKNKQALFALALAASHGDDVTRAAALAALPQVARTATHLFEFLNYAQQFRGWGKGLQKAVLRWYADKPVDRAAYQMVKYRQREGWTHADVLRKAHRHIDGVTGEHAARCSTGRWAVAKAWTSWATGSRPSCPRSSAPLRRCRQPTRWAPSCASSRPGTASPGRWSRTSSSTSFWSGRPCFLRGCRRRRSCASCRV
ncbi:Ro-like RNA binding protein [Mycobacterium phage Iota]|nr:Ro-like RNA binding protein [Mycobacterium phage Iota]